MEALYRDGIAVIGQAMHCCGDVHSAEDLFQLLVSCRDVSQKVPPSRFSAQAFGAVSGEVDDMRGKTDAPFGYFCSDVSSFDTSPGLFGLSPNECKHVDPQQRQLLMLTADAIQNAGLSLSEVYGSNTGVYVGNMNRDYMMLVADTNVINQFSSQGSASAIAANRISFTFNFRGVSIAVDSACSATGIGIHFAANDLRSGNIDMAVVGGFNLIVTAYNYVGLSQLHVLSKTGKTLAFDDRADGYTRGEGGGVVLLKRFEDAVRDGNRILGVLATTATCSNGRSVGAMAAPSGDGQLQMFHKTFRLAAKRGITPQDIQYVECHGTGTHRGDSVEVNACGDFLFKHTQIDEQPAAVVIGSVKANVGHLEAAACIPGLVKVLKAMEHGLIPKQINYQSPNRDIVPEYLQRLRIPTENTPWLPPTNGRPRMAVVNSYGYGGSISQLLVVEYRPPCTVPRLLPATGLHNALVIWGHTRGAVQKRKKMFAQSLAGLPHGASLEEYCATASRLSNNSGGFHAVVVGQTPAELIAKLEGAAVVSVAQRPKVVALVFPGQGSQGEVPLFFMRMPAYYQMVMRVEDWLQRTSKPYSVAESLVYKNSWPLSMQGLYIFTHEVALSASLYAAVPQLVSGDVQLIGHSLGEYAVAFRSGRLSLAQCCEAIWGIGEALEPLRGSGFMAEVSLAQADALSGVDVACINSPDKVIVSGPTRDMEAAAALAGAARIPNVDFPFHSAVMDSRRDAVRALLQRIHVPVDEWWENVRGCVKFTDKLAGVSVSPVLFLEMGQSTSLSPAVVRTTGIDAICASQYFIKTLVALRQHGYQVSWKEVYATQNVVENAIVPLPLHLEPHWFETLESFRQRMGYRPEAALKYPTSVLLDHFVALPITGKPEDSPVVLFEAVLDAQTFLLLKDHVFNQTTLVPGTFWIELFTSAAHTVLPPVVALSRLTDVEFRTACYTPVGTPTTVRLVITFVNITSMEIAAVFRYAADEPFVTAARAIIDFHTATASAAEMVAASMSKSFSSEFATGAVMHKEAWYEMFKGVNFDFGPRFQLLNRHDVFAVKGNLHSVLGAGVVKDRVRTELELNPEAFSDFDAWPFEVHPGILDAATQGMAVKRADGTISSSLPWKVGEVVHYGQLHRSAKYVSLLEVIESPLDIEVAHCLIGALTEDGAFTPVVLLRDFCCKVVESNMASDGRADDVDYYEMLLSATELDKSTSAFTGETVLIAPSFSTLWPNTASLSDALEVSSRLQRCIVLPCSDAASLDIAAAVSSASLSLVVVGVFVPSCTPEELQSHPVERSYEALSGFLDIVQAIERLQVKAANVHVVFFTDMRCLAAGEGCEVAVYRSLIGAFRAVVVEHGELRPRFVQYDRGCVPSALCDEIKFGWTQPKLESHVVVSDSERLVGFYEKIRPVKSPTKVADQLTVLGTGSWLVAGGCGAMGILLAKYLISIGAAHVFLCGRRGVGPNEEAEFKKLPQDRVSVVRLDVTVAADVAALLTRLEPPVRHVVNLSMVLHDRFIRSVTHEDIILVGSPKMAGAWNLHQCEAQLPNKYLTFLTMSSTTALVGTPGQYAYGSANCFMDGLVAHRRRNGLAAVSLQLGPVSGLGILAREEGAAAKALLERSGWVPHTPELLLKILTDVLLRSSHLPPVISPLHIAPNYFLPDHRSWASYTRLLQYFGAEEKGVKDATLDDALAVVKRILAQELRYSEQSIQNDTSLNNLGVTSMVQNILALAVQENFSGVSIPQRFFLSPEVTPLAIAREIISRLSKMNRTESEIVAETKVTQPPALIFAAGETPGDVAGTLKRLGEIAATNPGKLAFECVAASSERRPFRGATLLINGEFRSIPTSDMRQARCRVILVFPGQGTQYPGMAKPFYDSFANFRAAFDTAISFIEDRSIAQQLTVLLLEPTADASRLGETIFTQLALFVFSVSLGVVLLEAGVPVCAMGGHSVGEIAAKTVAGELALRDAVRLVTVRATEMSSRGHGKMAAVLLSEDLLKAKLAEWGSRVFIAAVNGAESTVVSGEANDVTAFIERCKASSIKVVALPNNYAFHSPKMAGAKAGVAACLSNTTLHTSSIPVTSNITGGWAKQDPAFYVDQISSAVQWDQCATTLLHHLEQNSDEGMNLYCLEVGPGTVLTNLMKKKTAALPIKFSACCAGTDPLEGFLGALGELWAASPSVSLEGFFGSGNGWSRHRRVMVTGAATFLGIYCLAHLLRHTPCIAAVSLPPGSDAARRTSLLEACDKFGLQPLDEADLRTRIVFIDLDEFDDDATDVLHVTTSANSLADYDSVKEANVVWASALAEKCITSGATLHYISTMSAMWGIENATETMIPSLEKSWMSRHTGYTQSKVVMEHKLRAFGAKKGLRFVIYRVDMLGGSSTSGAVGPNSYYTSLLRTILRTGKCATYMFGPTPRIAVDDAASQIVALAGATRSLPRVFHVTSGAELFSMREFAQGCELVPFEEFRQGIQSIDSQPFLSLIDTRSERHSQTSCDRQLTSEALALARYTPREISATRLAAAVRKWLEEHDC